MRRLPCIALFFILGLSVPGISSGQEGAASTDVLGEIAGGIQDINLSSEKCAEPTPETLKCPEPGSGGAGIDRKLASEDLEFLRERVVAVLEEKRLDRKYASSLQKELKNYTLMYWMLPATADVFFWRAELHRRGGEHEAMLVTLSKLIYEYPGSEYDDWAREGITNLLSEKGKLKRHRKYDHGLLEGPGGGSSADRFVKMLEHVSFFRERKYYPFVVEGCDEFLRRYPRHERADLVLTYKASAYVEMKQYRGATLSHERLTEIFPESSIRSASLFELARIYVDHLKEYEKAVAAYEEIVSAYPDGPETLSSYQNMALVYEKRLKRHESAIMALKAIIAKYPETPEALAAFKQMADIQVSSKDHKAAVESLSRLADMFRGEDAIKALERGAKLASLRLKYHELQIKLLQRIVDEYPESENAVNALYSIGDTMEKKLGDSAGAVNVYKSLIEKYPDHKLAASASKRVKKILGQ
jgi:TolA-binding protein